MRPILALLSRIYTSISQLDIDKGLGCGSSQENILTPILVYFLLLGKNEHIHKCNRTENPEPPFGKKAAITKKQYDLYASSFFFFFLIGISEQQ